MVGVPLSEVQGVPAKILQSAPNRSESSESLQKLWDCQYSIFVDDLQAQDRKIS